MSDPMEAAYAAALQRVLSGDERPTNGRLVDGHTQRAHSSLGASSAYRWFNCPGSVREVAGLNSESEWAAEGTAAHELAERVLNAPDTACAHDFMDEEIQVGNYAFLVDEDMADAVQVYVDTVKGDELPGDIVMVEHRFNLEQVRQGMFGTNDYLIYRPSTKRLTVYDYKHGAGKPVYPEENPQLLYYALGAALNNAWPIDEIEIVIVQPRIPMGEPVKRWSTDTLFLIAWAAELQAAADRTADPNAPLNAGPWCKASFCPKAGTCETLRSRGRAAAKMEFANAPASELSGEELAAILDEADLAKFWITSVWAEAAQRAENRDPNAAPGFKLVAKAARRKFVDIATPDAVAVDLVMGFGLSEDEIYTKKLKSPAQVEKLIPKSKWADLEKLWRKASSGNTLVREADQRAPVVKPTAASYFGL